MASYINYGTKVTADQEIVTLPQAKMNSRIDFADEDELLQIFVSAATAEIENFIGGPVVARKDITIERTGFGPVTIPFEISGVTKVEWLDGVGTPTAIAAEDFDYFSGEVNIGIEKPDGFSRLRVTCTAGYSAEDMPADIKRAALLIFSAADHYRANMPIKLNTSAQALLRPYKNY